LDADILTEDMSDSCVTTTLLDRAAVTTEKIAAKAVNTVDLQDTCATTEKIGRGQVTSEKLAAGAVATVDIAAGAVLFSKTSFAAGVDSLTSKGDTIRVTDAAITADSSACVILITPLQVGVGRIYRLHQGVGFFTAKSSGDETSPLWFHWEAKRIDN